MPTHIRAVKHDSKGTIHWQDENGQQYVSAGSNENTCLIFDPGYQTAGTLQHSDGLYYLNATSCSQRGSCAGGCRCNDCPKTITQGAHMLTDEDFETQMEWISKLAKGAAAAAKKGMKAAGKGLKAAGQAAQKGYAVAKDQTKKTVAALQHAREAYNAHNKAQAQSDSQNDHKKEQAQSDSQNENPTDHKEQAFSHLKEALEHLREAIFAMEKLSKVNTDNLSEDQKQKLANVKNAVEDASGLVTQLEQLANALVS